VVAAAVLLDADTALWALPERGGEINHFVHFKREGGCETHVFRVSGDVVGCFAVVRALGQPQPDRVAVGGRVIVGAALEAERDEEKLVRYLDEIPLEGIVQSVLTRRRFCSLSRRTFWRTASPP